MRVILTRHYQTLSNAEGRILGWSNSPPCPDWQADVSFIETRLLENGVSVDAIYSSSLERAQNTARSYAESFGVTEVITIPELNEINYGRLQTRKKSWVTEHYPLYKNCPNFVHPDGESFHQMQHRSVRFLSSLALAHPDITILIVAHAGVIRGNVSHFLGLEYAHCLKYKIPFRYIGDFLFEGDSCVRYDELGVVSEFVRTGTLGIPYVVADATA